MIFYHTEKNNCLQCCIAGILNYPLTNVVDVSSQSKYWVDSLKEWAALNELRIRFTYEVPEDIFYIGIVEWEIGKCHATVFQRGTQFYNPTQSDVTVYTTTLYNLIITKRNEYESIFKDNGEPIRTFMDSNDRA